jgi:hypothetical protein
MARPAAALALALLSCVAATTPRPVERLVGRPACPRDAAQDGSGRCACSDGTVAAFGACVAPKTGDAFCGPGGRSGAEGCTFRACGPRESVDVATGACVALASLSEVGEPCPAPAIEIIEGGHRACAPPEAGCPRGTRRSGSACVGVPRCPPGSLPEGSTCRALVVEDALSARRRVDVGAWVAIALGVDGGPGSPELCAPLALHPGAFDAARSSVPLRVRVDLTVPDQDLSRLHANIDARDATGHHLPPPAQSAARAAVNTLLEMLRALGGESTAAALSVDIACIVGAGPIETRDAGKDASSSEPPSPDEDEDEEPN